MEKEKKSNINLDTQTDYFDTYDDIHEEDLEGKAEEEAKPTEPNGRGKEAEEAKEDKADDKPEEETKKQTREENAHYAELRRKREAEEKEQHERELKEHDEQIKRKAKLDAELEMLGENPYTKEPIKDEQDLEVYKLQKKLYDEGKDPIQDLPSALAEFNRTKIQKEREEAEAKAKAEQERTDSIKKDVSEFVAKYPNVDTKELASNEEYQKFIKGKVGRWSSIEMYEGFMATQAMKKPEENKVDKATVEKEAKKLSNTPSSNASGKVNEKKIEDMTDEEYIAYNKKNSLDYF